MKVFGNKPNLNTRQFCGLYPDYRFKSKMKNNNNVQIKSHSMWKR
jgi:hypothetical protein